MILGDYGERSHARYALALGRGNELAKIKPGTKWLIYLLVDPRTEEVRYVGWTGSPSKRLQSHIRCAINGREKTHKSNWIKGLLLDGLTPRMDIVESGFGNHEEAESRWITIQKNAGHHLTNLTNGGEGMPGYSPTEETREKLRQAMRVRVFSEEHRLRISKAKKGVTSPAIKAQGKRRSEAVRGTKQSIETIEKRASALRGKKRSPELMERIRLSNIGRKRSAESRLKLSLSHMGIRKGQKASEETRRKISEARKGMKFSESHRAAISAAVKRLNAQKKSK